MPTYEFKCNKCDEEFETFVSISMKNNVKCPECKTQDITQLLTTFYTKGTGSSCGTCSASTCSSCSSKK